MLVERILWDQDTYKRDVLNGSPEGEDREWLFAGRFGTNLDIAGIEKIQLEAFGGPVSYTHLTLPTIYSE